MEEELESVGEYVSIQYTVKSLEDFAVKLLQNGVIISKGEK